MMHMPTSPVFRAWAMASLVGYILMSRLRSSISFALAGSRFSMLPPAMRAAASHVPTYWMSMTPTLPACLASHRSLYEVGAGLIIAGL